MLRFEDVAPDSPYLEEIDSIFLSEFPKENIPLSILHDCSGRKGHRCIALTDDGFVGFAYVVEENVFSSSYILR